MINKKMTGRKNGFTMAEVLIVVAIISVLAGVSFVSVINYLRSMKKLEFDGYAREIFMAAQNHLTMAEHEGYLGYTSFGEDEGDGVFHIISVDGNGFNNQDSVLNLMLPFGSVDNTIRVGGCYAIRYHKDTAQIMDVYYWSTTDPRFKLVDTANDRFKSDYSSFLGSSESDLKAYGTDKSVIGHYGDLAAGNLDLPHGAELQSPDLVVCNEEKLYAVVTDNNSSNTNAKLKLLITGVTSNSNKEILLQKNGLPYYVKWKEDTVGTETKNVYTIILDDVTNFGADSYHFSALLSSDGFIEGEDITIQAVAYNNEELTNIGSTVKRKTNSLFDSLGTVGTDNIVSIKNIRHLENLDTAISSFDYNDPKLLIKKAQQIKDIDWLDFKQKIRAIEAQYVTSPGGVDTVSIKYNSGDTLVEETGYYKPICPDYPLDYNGNNHEIRNVRVLCNKNGVDGGLIGSITAEASIIKNLKLVNFIITTTGAAGALAGQYTGNVDNVIAVKSDTGQSEVSSTGSTGVEKSAGGLIGELIMGNIDSCAASIYVESAKGNAGGLVGKVNAGSIIRSYSGGHTENAEYTSRVTFDVEATTGNAGGLVGYFGGTSIANSYSTCSVNGITAGGFVGESTKNISNCYCTGLVDGTSKGAFAGKLTGTGNLSNCYYYEMVNYDSVNNSFLDAIYIDLNPPRNVPYGLSAFDKDMTSYQSFIPTSFAPNSAAPYDTFLKDSCGGKYELPTIKNLDASLPGGKYVKTHYGDWPIPMIYIINE